ncbi:MAG: M81 family metallopeptidase [Oscillospiraceae bacterium]|nr:M81 family metallopeptidase [Oscillospiraceae bacterium]
MNKKIFLCGFHQETASFNPNPSTIEDYTGYIYQATGEELIAVNRGKNTLLGGMIDVAEESGYTVCGSANMCAHSGGPVQHEVVDIYLKQVLSDLKAALPVDAVLVFLHGATQSDVSDDVCGDVLTAIREVVGEDTVVSAGCDLHANVTERMMRAADYITGYQTYPHLDMCNTGKRAAMLAIRKLQGKPTCMAWTTVPQTAPAHGYTTTAGGLKTLMEKGFAMVERGEIIDFSIYQVQPWLDSCVSGSAVVVAAETEEKAKAVAAEFAAEEFALREELQGPKLWTMAETVQAAVDNTVDKPVVLVDSADSPGAGSTGDSATVLEYLLPHRDTMRAAVAVSDTAAVEKAYALGVGGKADFMLGGALSPTLSSPVEVKDCVVKSLHDGKFMLEGPASRGAEADMGKAAVLQAGQLLILVCGNCNNCKDPQFYRSVGIEPTLCRLVSVKACTSFRAAYEPISALICNTITPGAAGVELKILPFTHIPAPFYPFQETSADQIGAPQILRK